MTSEEASLLMSAHLNYRGKGEVSVESQKVISKIDLAQMYPYTKAEDGPFAAKELLSTDTEHTKGGWVFQDETAATFLIRNCLGGDDEWERRRLLSLKEDKRLFIDDITTM
jgi:hypothetical protein